MREAGFQPMRDDFSPRVAKITFYSFVRLKFPEKYVILVVKWCFVEDNLAKPAFLKKISLRIPLAVAKNDARHRI